MTIKSQTKNQLFSLIRSSKEVSLVFPSDDHLEEFTQIVKAIEDSPLSWYLNDTTKIHQDVAFNFSKKLKGEIDFPLYCTIVLKDYHQLDALIYWLYNQFRDTILK